MDATVVAILDDITVMGALAALISVEKSRDSLKKPANYLVKPPKAIRVHHERKTRDANTKCASRALCHLHRR